MESGQDDLKMNLPKTGFRGLSPELELVYEIMQIFVLVSVVNSFNDSCSYPVARHVHNCGMLP